MDESLRPNKVAPLIGSATALFAAALATLYTIGAVLTAGSLRNAELSIRDALPLIPLTQLLGRGMSVFLSSAGYSLFAILSVTTAVFLDLRYSRWVGQSSKLGREINRLRASVEQLDASEPERDRLLEQLVELESQLARSPSHLHRVRLIAMWTVLGSIALIAFYGRWYHLPWLGAMALVTLAALVGVLPVRYWSVLLYAALWFGILILAFYRPVPLPHATLETNDGEVITGSLVAKATGDWYVASRAREIIAVPEVRVRLATVETAEREDPTSRRIYQILWSWVP